MNAELTEARLCRHCGGRGWKHSGVSSGTYDCRHCRATGVVYMTPSDAAALDEKNSAIDDSLGMGLLMGFIWVVLGILVLMSTFVFGPWWLIAILIWIWTDR